MESNNENDQEKSIMLRHINEGHNGRKVEFSMKVIKAYQHDPLARQCAEAVWIRKVEPQKRINNKNEFHQPGDIEAIYENNENQEFKKIKNLQQSQKSKRKIKLLYLFLVTT